MMLIIHLFRWKKQFHPLALLLRLSVRALIIPIYDKERAMSLRCLFRFVLGVALTVSVAGFARAQCQYPPCSTTDPTMSLGSAPSGSYGHGAAIGIGVAAAAAVVVIALYVHQIGRAHV